MNPLARTLVALLAVLLPSALFAQQKTQLDAVAVSPDRFVILLENEDVRVIEYTLRPGERDQWHSHPPKVSYVVSGGKLRIHLADGTSFQSDEKQGSAVWMDALPRHYAENVGSTPVRIILTEVKAQRAQTPTSNVVGTWLLESIVDSLQDGSIAHWMGQRPTGVIMYAASGHMSVQFMRDPRPRLPGSAESGDAARLAGARPFASLPPDQLRDLLEGYYAYFGTYRVNTVGDSVAHVVTSSLRPTEVGVTYRRAIRISGDRLYISLNATEDGAPRRRVLTWRRAPDQ